MAINANENIKCPVCRDRFDPQAMYVDYMFETGWIRGLICQRCRHGFVSFQEDEDVLRRARNYIQTSGFGYGFPAISGNIG